MSLTTAAASEPNSCLSGQHSNPFQPSGVAYIYVVVNFLFQVIFIFLLFLGMVIYANEVETKEK